MSSRSEISTRIAEAGIVAIIRTPTRELVRPVCEALIDGGLLVMEITMTVPDALGALREISKDFGARALLGAGTILTAQQCHAAIDAGAEFIVTPITKLEIIEAAHSRNKPVMLGAYTPTEAQLAHEAGADFIKIFPADKLGPGYIKNIRAPLPHLRIVPTGGVDLQTAPEFLKAGSVALGVGSSLIGAEILKTKNWTELTRLAKEFVRLVQQAR
ncbi:MAG TPA: bifunctional 4-hydroxy-2-oxoglutarate aldolase/2-dehydro-3-deoxy-phosphogluconate aldolase [Methylomirabilota bacterium]|nr:bifunctional 4-hydroxy-2-oxoglutarate aldolase/2-dehydro-3-deoxy-phosphogluconate aldolase [Methylomirabilota bacterium]